MSTASTSAAGPSPLLRPAAPPADLPRRADDPRLGELTTFWAASPTTLPPNQVVLIGFPQDEGVRRNGGRTGAALAPGEVRRWLYRLTPYARRPRLVDLGDVVVDANLERSQDHLGSVLAAVLQASCLPVVLGGGHETAYGSYLGYVEARRSVGLVNLDAHLDVRPLLGGQGHSGSPFRQAMDHPTHPLPGPAYSCLGAQPFSIAADHLHYVTERGGRVSWAEEVHGRLETAFLLERDHLLTRDCSIHLSIAADVVCAADVPGVSAPGPLGLDGREVAQLARRAGGLSGVSGMDLVEINPTLDPDGRSSRWGALVLWHFLAGAESRALW